MVKAEAALETERERVTAYLNSASEGKLLGVVETEVGAQTSLVTQPIWRHPCSLSHLLQNNFRTPTLNSRTRPRPPTLQILEKREMALLEKEGSGCRVLLANDKHDDLARMYR
jgi:hypothetical protein